MERCVSSKMILFSPQAAATAYKKAVQAHPTHSSILCKYGGFVKHVENDYEKVCPC